MVPERLRGVLHAHSVKVRIYCNVLYCITIRYNIYEIRYNIYA